ncbi:uncharacterized protein LOC119449238 [Dermacentor silvarum]|uniref:uncharacterized protein LOC119449238 n=1 Tax=Dermacentor silvarum TaxID=543639 RepID=UPI0018983253|nr:uncharacterized protein LOC119449238 [Dermacentor silvarum]
MKYIGGYGATVQTGYLRRKRLYQQDQCSQASKEERLRPRKLGATSSAAALQSSFRSPEASSSSSRQLFPRRTQSLPGSKTSRFRAVSREPPQSDLEENTIVVTRGRHAQQRHTPLLAAAGTRLRYVPARNTHTVRLNRFKVRLTARPDASSEPSSAEEEPAAATPSSMSSAPPPVEASDDVDPLVSIDPARVRYEPTTLTSLVTLHAAQGKSVVRTLTITTSVPRTLEPSELVSNGILEGSEGPPAALTMAPIDGSDEQTPPLVVSSLSNLPGYLFLSAHGTATSMEPSWPLGPRLAQQYFQRLPYKSMGGANDRFQREFLNVEFGHGCRVYDRLWSDVNLSTLNSVRDFEKRNVAVQVLRKAFPAENVRPRRDEGREQFLQQYLQQYLQQQGGSST